MHLDIVPNRNSAPALLLRESYRDEDGNVKKRTHANLTQALTLEQAYKFRAVLQGADLAESALEQAFEILASKSHGHVAAVLGTLNHLNFAATLGRGDTPERRNALAEEFRLDGDPATVGDQLGKIRQRFGLQKVIIVGDRGMLTSTRLDAAAEDPALRDYGWISALRSGQIRTLVRAGDLQPELFDQRALAEIHSDEFPGERLVICRNPALAAERSRKREELLQASEQALRAIQLACRRPKNAYHGQPRIARRVERQVAKYKMLKHFELQIGEQDLTFQRNTAAIEEERRLDGFYVIRARNVPAADMSDTQLMATYKSLSGVERVFRNLKTTSLEVRPIFHRQSDMVRSHIFLCLLAAHVQWHMERKLAPLLFADEQLADQKTLRATPVEVTARSESAKHKARTKRTEAGLTVHSFRSLLDELGGLCRVECRPKLAGASTFTKLSQATAEQAEALRLLEVRL